MDLSKSVIIKRILGEEKVDAPDVQFEFQQLGLEMEAHFGKKEKKRIWPLFYKADYPISVLRESWFTYLKTSKTSFNYFMGILNRKAGLKK